MYMLRCAERHNIHSSFLCLSVCPDIEMMFQNSDWVIFSEVVKYSWLLGLGESHVYSVAIYPSQKLSSRLLVLMCECSLAISLLGFNYILELQFLCILSFGNSV